MRQHYTNVVMLGLSQVTNRAFGVVSREIPRSGHHRGRYQTNGSGRTASSPILCSSPATSDPNVTNQFLYNDREELNFCSAPMARAVANASPSTTWAGPSLIAGDLRGRATFAPMDWAYSYYNDNGEPT